MSGRTLLLEIGVEEIPAGFLAGGRIALRTRAVEAFREAGVETGEIRVHATPRRMALIALGLSDSTKERTQEWKGPPVKAAFGEDGEPTRAAIGFAAKHGVDVLALETRDGYVHARKTFSGGAIRDAIASAAPRVLDGFPWPKFMRWNSTGTRWVRPVRWLVALLDEEIVSVSWGGLVAGRTTMLRRSSGAGVACARTIPSASAYIATLRDEGVIVDEVERAREIASAAVAMARSRGAEPVAMTGDETWAYLADHVEGPIAIEGEFPQSYAALPREILELTMWRHQKYVPLTKNGSLLPSYIIVANRTFATPAMNRDSSEAFIRHVKEGNRRVLAARLSDAEYFWKTDMERPLIDRLDDLERVTFQKGAGSVRDRVARIEKTAHAIAPAFGKFRDEEISRAARLAKADLTTKLVFEFPELQGVIGRRIAEAQGEPAEVARAIEEHYWPLGGAPLRADARLPEGIASVIALADKADLLETIFGLGHEPTGSADPFGLRRAAIGIVRILLSVGENFDALNLVTSPMVRDFLRGRLVHYYAGQGVNAAIAEAVAESGWSRLPDFDRRARAANVLPERSDFGDLKTSFKRVMNILKDGGGIADKVAPALLSDEAEKNLHREVASLDACVTRFMGAKNAEGALGAMAGIRPHIDRFFDEVMVNTEEAALRNNRRALLRDLGTVFMRFMDFSRL